MKKIINLIFLAAISLLLYIYTFGISYRIEAKNKIIFNKTNSGLIKFKGDDKEILFFNDTLERIIFDNRNELGIRIKKEQLLSIYNSKSKRDCYYSLYANGKNDFLGYTILNFDGYDFLGVINLDKIDTFKRMTLTINNLPYNNVIKIEGDIKAYPISNVRKGIPCVYWNEDKGLLRISIDSTKNYDRVF